jgi:hypothetical protein
VALTVTCPKCAHTLKAKDELAGKKVMCPKCESIITIPAASPSRPKPGSSAVASRERSTHPAAQPVPAVSRDQVLGAFHGKIVLPQVSSIRKLATVLVLGILLVLVIGYLAILGSLAWVVFWLATSDFGSAIPSAAISLAMAGAAIILLALLRPLVMPQERSQEAHPLEPGQQPLLADFVARVCQQIECPPPAVLQVDCSPRLTIDQSGRTLTIGLALAAGLSVNQLAGLIIGLLAKHRRNAASGPTNLIRVINGWLWRSVYQQDRFDQWITRVNLRPGFHLGRLVLPLRALSFVGRAALWIPMFIGNTAAAALVRRSMLDADLCSARLVGKRTFAITIERAKIIEYTCDGTVSELPFLYRDQKLPDSLPHELAARLRDLTPELCSTLLETIIKIETIPFDSRPSEADRLAAVATESEEGVLSCPLPAHVLWADFPKLAREITFDYYAAAFGAQHIKMALRPVS